jgi:hypothetical protein
MPDGQQPGGQQERAERNITFTRDYSVGLPRGETAYMIPATEWNRIKKMIKRLVPAKDWFVVAGSVCAGVFFSAVFCLIGFAASNNVPVWAKAVAWSASVCALLLGACFFYLDTQQRSNLKESTNDVTLEMEQLEALCQASKLDEQSAQERAALPEAPRC